MSTALVALPTFAKPAFAQTTSSSTSRETFSIAPQPLAQALTQFSVATGLQLFFGNDLTAGLTTGGVSGPYTSQAALDLLLSGTGLSYRFVNANTVTIVKIPGQADGAGAMALPPLQVTGQHGSAAQSPYGPGVGYVATRSVSATKTDTPEIATPQAITTITADQIKDQGAQTLGAALRYAPGVVAEEYGGTDLRLDEWMIRGFGDSMPYIDGLATTGRYTLLSDDVEPYGLERVEVVHGPSSVLYGQNAPGGIIDVTTKRPTATPRHEVQLQTGSYGRIQGAFDLSGPLTNDGTWLYRITGLARDVGTQVDHVRDHRYYIAPAVTWQPSADTSFTLLSHFQSQKDGMLSQQLPAEGTLSWSPFGNISPSLFTGEPDFNKWNHTEWSIGYAFEHHFDNVWTVRQNVRYAQSDVDVGYVYGDGLEAGTDTLDRSALAAQAWVANIDADTSTQAKYRTGPVAHTTLFGVDVSHSRDRWTEEDGTAASLNLADPVYGGAIDLPAPDFATIDTLFQTGLYAQDQIAWQQRRLTASVRHDWANTTVQDEIADTTTPQHDQATTGRVELVYLFDSGLAPYVSYSTSFQPSIGTSFDGTPYQPTTGKQYETGVKYQPPGFNSFVTLSTYQLTENNMLTTDLEHPLFEIQTGAARVRGVKLSGTADLGQGLKLVGAYTYMGATITKANDGTEGNRPAGVPTNMASIWADKSFLSGRIKGFGFGGGVRYIGSTYGDDASTMHIPSVALVDAEIHYGIANWMLAINATNLFNKTYVATCEGTSQCFYGLQRTVLGTLTYHW